MSRIWRAQRPLLEDVQREMLCSAMRFPKLYHAEVRIRDIMVRGKDGGFTTPKPYDELVSHAMLCIKPLIDLIVGGRNHKGHILSPPGPPRDSLQQKRWGWMRVSLFYGDNLTDLRILAKCTHDIFAALRHRPSDTLLRKRWPVDRWLGFHVHVWAGLVNHVGSRLARYAAKPRLIKPQVVADSLILDDKLTGSIRPDYLPYWVKAIKHDMLRVCLPQTGVFQASADAIGFLLNGEPSDGPTEDFGFSWKGKQVPLEPIPYKLLRYLWRQIYRRAKVEDVAEHVWGSSSHSEHAINTAKMRVNTALIEVGCPWKVRTKQGQVILD